MNMFSRNPYNGEPGGLKRWLADLPSSVRWGAPAAALIAVIFIGWLGIQGLAAKSNLEKARDSAEQAKDALLSGKSEDATRFAENAQFHARQAQAATHSVPWNIAAAVPLIGSPLRTTQQISDVVVGLASDFLLPAASMGAGLSPDKLIEGTRINLQALRTEEPRLTDLSTTATKLNAEAQAVSKPAYFSLINDARSQLQDQTSRLAQLLGNTALAAQLAPSMLGADGPRNYALVFQNNAEARGTGGLLGGSAILRFDNGKPSIDRQISNTLLGGATAVVDLGPEFNKVYGWTNPFTDFRNSNMSPHFPYAAQIWRSMWEREYGEIIDGVIATDPVALSYILGATGPIKLPPGFGSDGEEITQQNVVELTASTAYERFPTDRGERKRYLYGVAKAVIDEITGKISSPRKLLDALGQAANEGRIAVWSAFPAEQKILEKTQLAHAVPDDSAPYAAVILNNLAGNKMDYYLRREIEYVADDCDGDVRNSTITVKLTNAAPDRPLPEEVTGIMGLAPEIRLNAPPGTMVTSVRVLATKGARLLGVTSDGKRASAIVHSENGRPSYEVQVAIPPGQSGELSFRLSEPTAPGVPRVPVQPLVDNVVPKVSVPECGPR
jgi:hypothetical protein